MNTKDLISSIYNPPVNAKYTSQALDGIYKNSHLRPFSLARHALLEGLKSLKFQTGDKVLIPSFICRDVLAPFHVAGLKIEFYDVDENLNLKNEPKDLPAAKAIMAIHYFGLETNLSPFKEYCDLHQAFLIEDNAHGFLSANEMGLLGTFGDIGIISLRKSLPIENGALLLSQKDLPQKALTPSSVKPSFRLKVKNALRPLVSQLGVHALIRLTRLKRKLRKLLKGSDVPQSGFEDEREIPGNPQPSDFEAYIGKMNLDLEKLRRRELFEHFLKIFSASPARPLRSQLSKHEVPYVFPFFCEPEHLEEIENLVNKAGSEIVPWPALPEQVAPTAPSFYNQLYFIKFLW